MGNATGGVLADAALGLDIRTVGDMGKLPDSLPVFLFPDIPWTLQILLPVSVTLAVVGLLESLMTADGSCVYVVRGQVFFASAVQFTNNFDYLHAPSKVVIDLRHAHFWDTSAVAALDRVVLKFRKHGAEVEVIGFNEAGELLVDKLGTHRDEDASLATSH